MSYLLTEIALEMLGYKFYDTNGLFHLTNFQQSQTASQAETYPDEPPLLEYIDQPDAVKAQNGTQTNGHRSTSPPTSTTSHVVVDIDKSGKQRRTPARALAKIMNYESDKIRNQITARLEKTIADKKAVADEQLLEACLAEEQKNVQDDACDMQLFREFLEERLRRIDSRPYVKYLRTFRAE